MPDYLSHTISVLQGINNLGQSNANIEATQQLTQMRSMETEAMKRQMAGEEEARRTLANFAQTRLARDQTQAGVSDGLDALGATDLGKPLVDSYRKEVATTKAYSDQAQALAASGKANVKDIEHYQDKALASEAKSRDLMGKILSYKQEQRRELSSVAGAYEPDGSNLPDVVRQIRAVDPQALANASFDRDADGQVIAGPRTTRAMDTLSKQNLTAAESLRLKHDAMQAEANARRDDQRERAQREREIMDDRRTAQMQHSMEQSDRRLAASESRTAAMLRMSGNKFDEGQYKATQATVDKIAKDYKAIDYTKAYEVANRVESVLTDPARGYADVTTATARALSDQFKLEIDNFRPRGGGKYQEAEMSKMNGVLQKLEKYVTTIGEGDKILAKDVMLQTTREMKELASDRHADLIKEELKRADSYKRRGGDPTLLTLNGDVDMVVKSGKAKRVKDGNKEYLVFGKEKKDMFELPSNDPSE